MAEPRNRYSIVSLIMHWTIAAAVLAQVLLVTAHEATEGPISREFISLHKSVGLTILVLTWRESAGVWPIRPSPCQAICRDGRRLWRAPFTCFSTRP